MSCAACARISLACAVVLGALLAGMGGAEPSASPAWPRTSSTRTASCSPPARPTSASWSPHGRAGHRLYLNGNLQFAERDEYRYHEALVHPAHGGPRRAQARGGAGRRRRHGGARDPQIPPVESVTLVELDPAMTRSVQPATPTLARLNGQRPARPSVKIVNTDAFQWLQDRPGHLRCDRGGLSGSDQLLPSASSTPTAFTRCWTSASRPAATRWCRPPRRWWRAPRASGPWCRTIESVGLRHGALPCACAQLWRIGAL